jgi:hypothetical protein
MLGLIISGVMNQATNLFDILHVTVEERNGGSKVIAIMRRDLQGIINTGKAIEVREDEHEEMVINFVTTGRLSANERGTVAPFSECGYATRPSPLNSNLLLLYRRHDWYVDEESMRGGVWELLCDRVRSINFSFRNEQNDYTRAWPDGEMPTNIILEIEILDTDVDLKNISINPDNWEVESYREVISVN